jgi:hypothetical protein
MVGPKLEVPLPDEKTPPEESENQQEDPTVVFPELDDSTETTTVGGRTWMLTHGVILAFGDLTRRDPIVHISSALRPLSSSGRPDRRRTTSSDHRNYAVVFRERWKLMDFCTPARLDR